jgi:1-deoxy-D-xylulose-5-phosphate reductoisomerase
MIEAYYLFGLTPRHYDVWIHPQSIVHSLVEYRDGVLLAQMGIPSMLPPIAYAYSWPDRLDLPDVRCDLPRWPDLSFMTPDENRFPIFKLRHTILEGGAAAQIAFAVSAEEAVFAFLNNRLSFCSIVNVITEALEHPVCSTSMNMLSESIQAVMTYVNKVRTASQKIVTRFCA